MNSAFIKLGALLFGMGIWGTGFTSLAYDMTGFQVEDAQASTTTPLACDISLSEGTITSDWGQLIVNPPASYNIPDGYYGLEYFIGISETNITAATLTYSFSYGGAAYSGTMDLTGSDGNLSGAKNIPIASSGSGASSDDSTITTTTDTDATAETSAPAPAPAVTLESVANNPVATGQLFAASASKMGTSETVAGAGVTVRGISDITDQAALAALTPEYDTLWNQYTKAGGTEVVRFAFDLNATGSGTVTFNTGAKPTDGVPMFAIISHYHNGMWTRQIRTVNADGTTSGTFASFSPIHITVVSGLTKDQLRAAGITETESVSATSPKTAEEDLSLYIALIGMVAAAGLLLSVRKRNV